MLRAYCVIIIFMFTTNEKRMKYDFVFVFQPFLASIKPENRTLLLLISMSWLIALLLAVLPFTVSLQYLFLDLAIIPNNPFFRSVSVSFSSAKTWVQRLLTFEPDFVNATANFAKDIQDATTWSDLQSVLQTTNHIQIFQPKGYIG